MMGQSDMSVLGITSTPEYFPSSRTDNQPIRHIFFQVYA